MKFLKKIRLIAEWLFDWYVLPVVEALRPQPKDSTAKPKDEGLTLGDE